MTDNGLMLNRLRLKEVLQEQGRQHQWLASQLDVAPETIGRYLTGANTPPKATAIALSKILDVPVSELWTPDEV